MTGTIQPEKNYYDYYSGLNNFTGYTEAVFEYNINYAVDQTTALLSIQLPDIHLPYLGTTTVTLLGSIRISGLVAAYKSFTVDAPKQLADVTFSARHQLNRAGALHITYVMVGHLLGAIRDISYSIELSWLHNGDRRAAYELTTKVQDILTRYNIRTPGLAIGASSGIEPPLAPNDHQEEAQGWDYCD